MTKNLFDSSLLLKTIFGASLLTLISCAQKPVVSEKKELVFITGSHLNETSWDFVINDLDKTQYSTLRLTRDGRDPNNPSHLKQIAEAACGKIRAKSILVAHSFGGATANEISGVCPDKVSKIIYVSALVPLNQESPTEFLKGADQKKYLSAVKIEKDRISPKSKLEFTSALDSEVHMAEVQLPPVFSESMVTLGDKVSFDQKAYSAIPKYYIYTTLDQIISLESQKKLSSRIQLTGSNSLTSGHLPMLSKPKELAEMISAFTKD